MVLLAVALTACGGNPGLQPPSTVAHLEVAQRSSYCGDGRVDSDEVCDWGVIWDEDCPEGWGLCWQCQDGCQAWTAFALSRGPGWELQRVMRGGTVQAVGLGYPPLACEERTGDNVTRRTFDSKGRITQLEGIGQSADWSWDSSGGAVMRRNGQISTWSPTEESAAADPETVRLNDSGRPRVLMGADGRLRSFSDGTPLTEVTYERDQQGRTISARHQSAGGNIAIWDWEWGAFGILKEVRHAGEEERITTWAYDEAGNVVSYTEGGFNERIGRDALGRTISHVRTDSVGHGHLSNFERSLRWDEQSHLLGGDAYVLLFFRTPVYARWDWSDGVLLSGEFGQRAPMFSPPTHYDFSCLDQVMRTMPRRGYSERPAGPVIRTPAELLVALPGRASGEGIEWRNRYDPTDWMFEF